MADKPIIVAGAGLGGLGAALGLAKNGKRVIVLEKAPELGEIGAGIQLGPNAFNAFDYFEVGKGAREQAVYVAKSSASWMRLPRKKSPTSPLATISVKSSAIPMP